MASSQRRGARWRAQVRRRGLTLLSRTFERHEEAARWVQTVEDRLAVGEFLDLSEATDGAVSKGLVLSSTSGIKLAARARGRSMTDAAVQPKISVDTRDGRRMWRRPIRPEDAPALQRAYARMDSRDQRARLFAPIAALTDQAAQQFCTIDETHELCLVLEADDEPGEILGGGRLMGEPSGQSAEFAVSLRSDLKGRGLGRMLLAALLDLAPRMGFKVVWGLILADNAPMRVLAEKLGFRITRDPDDRELVKAVFVSPSS